MLLSVELSLSLPHLLHSGQENAVSSSIPTIIPAIKWCEMTVVYTYQGRLISICIILCEYCCSLTDIVECIYWPESETIVPTEWCDVRGGRTGGGRLCSTLSSSALKSYRGYSIWKQSKIVCRIANICADDWVNHYAWYILDICAKMPVVSISSSQYVRPFTIAHMLINKVLRTINKAHSLKKNCCKSNFKTRQKHICTHVHIQRTCLVL